ncbi:MAG: UDP-N-acetylmuramate dehydrogenase [bacterium]|nr:UDP-N-acetylmuramate dehydrogenase [bacterium]
MGLEYIKSCEIKINEKLSSHTSFRIGGTCDTFMVPKTTTGLKLAIRYVAQNKLPLLVIGNGTNILVPDDGITGVVIKIGEPYFCKFHLPTQCRDTPWRVLTIRVGVGISLQQLLKITANHSLSGLEFTAGIPGTLGGAIVMNAGAQRKTISEVIERVKVVDKSGNVYWVKNCESNFGYRDSRFRNSSEIIIEAELKLKKGDTVKIKNEIQEILKKREASLPLKLPSAGCVFKNPNNAIAGKLIELAGCKGLRSGDAQVSSKHANFIVNIGNATYKDVKTLISDVQHKVYEKFRIYLEPELVIL